MEFICPKCGNTDYRYVGFRNGKPYCRRCISFIGNVAEGNYLIKKECNYSLNYQLTDDQKLLSKQLLENFIEKRNSLVFAVCGAGKTEIVLEVIKYAINNKMRCGFCVPRRDVVIELSERFSSIFKDNNVISVYGGHVDKLEGDFVIFTSHQLYRYNHYFDLLIMDEIDAFPYKDNLVLYSFFNKAIKGNHILMSATADEKTIKEYSSGNNRLLELYSRFHMHPLPVPNVYLGNSFRKFVKMYNLLKTYKKSGKRVFIFTPTIEDSERVSFILSFFFKGGTYVHSKRENRNEIITNFKKGKYWYLVTTAVLERGVTVKDLQVIVFKADSPLYNRYSLIQIAGRVGRKKEAPEGEVIFLVSKNNDEIKGCIDKIVSANEHLQKVL